MPESIRNFCDRIGVSKRENTIDIAALEYSIRHHLNRVAPRVMAVLNPVKLIIDNYPEDEVEWLKTENNPERENAGVREIPFTKALYIERADFREVAGPEYFRLALGGEVRLYDRLFDDPEPDGHKDKNFMDFINPNSLTVRSAYGEPSVQFLPTGHRVQFQRLGYFSVDPDSTADKKVFNRIVTLRDTYAKVQSKG